MTTAASGRDALFLLLKGAVFDAIVTDTDMPEMDGYTLARQIKQEPRTAAIPIIALATHAAPIINEAAARAGMCGVVGKFDRPGLLATLRANLDTKMLGRTRWKSASSGSSRRERRGTPSPPYRGVASGGVTP